MFTALKELGFDKYEIELKEFLRNYHADQEQTKLAASKKRTNENPTIEPPKKRAVPMETGSEHDY